MDFFKRASDSIRQMWTHLSSSQKVLLSACLALVFVILVWAGTSTAGESMTRVVGHEVDEAARARVIAKLKERNQRYEVRNLEVYVPRQDADRVILELGGEGVLSDGDIYKFLEESNILIGPGQQEKRMQVAIQRKLELMIRRIDGIRNANVLLNFAPTSSFAGAAKPGASVMVELASGKVLTQGNVDAITGMVARVVPRLESEEVILTDTRGTRYRARKDKGDAIAGLDLRAHERSIEMDLEERITRFIPGASAVVRVQARSQSGTVRQVKHDKGAPTHESFSSRKDGSSAGSSGGIKGTDSLDPAASRGGRGEEERQEEVRHAVDIQETNTVKPSGDIEKITASVSVPIEVGADGKMDDAAAARRVAELKPLVIKALGPQATDADVSIAPVPVLRMGAMAPAPVPGFLEGLLEFLAAHGTKIAMVVLALLGLGFMIRVAGRAIPKSTSEELADLRARIEEPEAPAGELALAGEQAEAARLKSGIRDLVSRNPAGGGAILNRWLSGK